MDVDLRSARVKSSIRVAAVRPYHDHCSKKSSEGAIPTTQSTVGENRAFARRKLGLVEKQREGLAEKTH